jgi:hypothetical protein
VNVQIHQAWRQKQAPAVHAPTFAARRLRTEGGHPTVFHPYTAGRNPPAGKHEPHMVNAEEFARAARSLSLWRVQRFHSTWTSKATSPSFSMFP